MSDGSNELKRINFFRGFLTTEQDWNDAESYHVRKRMLHNRHLHGAGVVPGALEQFRVSARGRGEMAVVVSPGYAIDGEGHDIVLFEPVVKPVVMGDFDKLPATVRLVARYVEEPTDYIKYKHNPDYRGHRRIAERVRLDFVLRDADASTEIELARLKLTPEASRINDARDSLSPGDNEIDLRFVPVAGTVGTDIPPELLVRLLGVITDNRRIFATLAHDKKILSAGAVLSAYVTLEMFLHASLVDRRSFFEHARSVLLLEDGVVREIERTAPDLSRTDEFYNFKEAIRRSLGEYGERAHDLELLLQLVSNQEKCGKALVPLLEGLMVSGDEAFEQERRPTEELVARLAVDSSLRPDTDLVTVDDLALRVVDVLDVLDPRSEEQHKFKIVGERDKYRSRQTLSYPDGVEVEDTGIGYEGGYAEFEIQNLDVHKDVVILMRSDYVHGDWKADMFIGHERIGTWDCPGEDREHRWRNHGFIVDAKYVKDSRLLIRQEPVARDRDINMFRFWFLQPANREAAE